jgi:hypothetical protein
MATNSNQPESKKIVPLGPALTAAELAAEMGDGSDARDVESAKTRFRKNAPASYENLLDAETEDSG